MRILTRDCVPAILVMTIAAVLAWAFVASSLLAQPDPETLAVRAAAEGAIRALYFDGFPPASYRGGPFPWLEAQAIRDRVTNDIERYFTPALQDRYRPMILAAVGQIGTGVWDAQGDLTIDWGRTTMTGDKATIDFREHGWTIRRAAASIAPISSWRLDSSWDWEVTLLREGDQWRVDGVESSCVDGCP